MNLRIGVHYDLRGGVGSEPALGVLAEHARAVEGAGADVIWVGERPTEPDAWIAAAFPVCAALAVATERVRIGTAVVPLLLHHPLRVAEDAATLDALSGGRFELGVGLGGDRDALSGFGIDGGRLAGRLDESLELVRAAWRGPLDFDGRHFQVTGIEVSPRPVQPEGPPVWVGGASPAAQRRAARQGAGLILPIGSSPEAYLEARTAAGCEAADARLAVLVPETAWRDTAAELDREVRSLSLAARGGWLDFVLSVTTSATGLDAVVAAIAALDEAHPTRRGRYTERPAQERS